jgi:hypothetical protein
MYGAALAIIVFCIVLLTYSSGEAAGVLAMISQGIAGGFSVLIIAAILFTRKLRFPTEWVLLGTYLGWCLICFPFSTYPTISLFYLKTYGKLFIIAFAAFNAISGRTTYKWVLVAIVLGTVFASLGGITGLMRGSEGSLSDSGSRFTGSFGNANGMGNLCIWSFWALCQLFFLVRSKFWKLVILGTGVHLLGVIAMTGSRQAMISMVLLWLGGYWFVVRKTSNSLGKRGGILVITALAIMVFLIYLSTTEHWYRVVEMLGISENQGWTTKSDTDRKMFLQVSGRTFLHHPIVGVGLGGIRAILGISQYAPMGHSPHNTFLAVGANNGFPGWLLFFSGPLLMVWKLRRILRQPIPMIDRKLLLGIRMFFPVLLLWSFTTELLIMKHLWVICFANLGYLYWVESKLSSELAYVEYATENGIVFPHNQAHKHNQYQWSSNG